MSLANYGRACMLSSHDPLPFIHLIVFHNQAVWARAAGTDGVKSAVNVSSSALYRLTICIRSDDTIRPNTNNYSEHYSPPKRIFGTSLIKSVSKAPVISPEYILYIHGTSYAKIYSRPIALAYTQVSRDYNKKTPNISPSVVQKPEIFTSQSLLAL